MELAGKIVKESDSDSLRNWWARERYRRGDEEAIKDYPYGEMTFYAAWGLAKMLVELGDYERAEEFVTGLKNTVGNSPEEITGVIFKTIALEYREKGDLEKTKRYIDRALEISWGRGTGYVGYAVKIAHRSIHGRSTEGLEESAQMGAYFPRHMGSELVQNLARDLVRTGFDEEAKRSVALLRESKDVADSMRWIAVSQAERGDMEAALETVEEIEDWEAQGRARMGIAGELCKAGQSDAAEELADVVLRELKERGGGDSTLWRDLAAFYARPESRTKLEQVIDQAPTPESKADRVLRAIRGFADGVKERSQG